MLERVLVRERLSGAERRVAERCPGCIGEAPDEGVAASDGPALMRRFKDKATARGKRAAEIFTQVGPLPIRCLLVLTASILCQHA